MADKQKFIQCDCWGEGMLITKFDDEEEMYFSYWRQGINPIKLSWWMRLKLCWMVITKGNYYEDQVILNKQKSKELALWILQEYLQGYLRETDKEEHSNWENEGGGNLSNLPEEGCEGGHY